MTIAHPAPTELDDRYGSPVPEIPQERIDQARARVRAVEDAERALADARRARADDVRAFYAEYAGQLSEKEMARLFGLPDSTFRGDRKSPPVD